MKRKLLLILMLLLTVTAVSANFGINEIDLGGENQQRGRSISQTITVSNMGSMDINNIQARLSGVSSIYDANVTVLSTSASVNGTFQIRIDAYVPLSLDAVDSRGRKIAINIGNVVFEGDYSDGSDVSRSVTLFMEAENNLEFGGDTEITFGDETNDLDDGDTFDDGDGVQRGQDVIIQVEAENNFDNRGDCEDDGTDCVIEDVEVDFDSPSDLDWDDELRIGDIDPEETETDSITFEIDDNVDEDDYDIEMWITGEDENGALHGEYMEFTIEVDVPRDEVLITSADFSPEIVDCESRTTLDVNIKNTGRDDQNEVSIEVTEPDLDWREHRLNIELDEGDSTRERFSLSVPEDADPGTYYVTIIANVDHDEETDRQVAALTIRECQPEPEPTDETEEPDSNTDVNIIDIPATSGVIYGEPKDETFFESSQYIMILGVLVVIAFIMLLILLAVLLK